jgi:hypothetical protein
MKNVSYFPLVWKKKPYKKYPRNSNQHTTQMPLNEGA